MITAGLVFLVFMGMYALGIGACIYQENELSLPHEKVVRMTTMIVVLSALLFGVALWAFFHIRWDLFFSHP